MTFKKNQIVITALVAMIGAAGYLNYIDTHPDTSQVMMTDEGDLAMVWDDEALQAVDENNEIAVNNEKTSEVTTAKSTAKNESNGEQAVTSSENNQSANASSAGEAVFVNSSNDSSYFIQAKLDREQARSKEKDLLNEMLSNENIEASKKSDAANAMLEIQQRIERETASEAMIEAKGFKEVYVRIDNDTVDVVVDKAQLTDAEVAQIEDIIKRKTGVSGDKIRISPLK